VPTFVAARFWERRHTSDYRQRRSRPELAPSRGWTGSRLILLSPRECPRGAMVEPKIRRGCPSCRETMGRLCTDRTTRSRQAWYQLSRTRFYCPKCGIEVLPITRPIGYVFQGLGVVIMAASLWFFCEATWRTWTAAVIAGSTLVLVAISAWLSQRWGFSYVLAADSSRCELGAGKDECR